MRIFFFYSAIQFICHLESDQNLLSNIGNIIGALDVCVWIEFLVSNKKQSKKQMQMNCNEESVDDKEFAQTPNP